MSRIVSRLIPCLWFNGEAEAAAGHYVGIFPNSRVTEVMRWPMDGMAPAGSVLTVTFELDGTIFVGLNGGPQFTFTEAVSFQVICDTQDEIDHYWSRLGEGGKEIECGWIKDRFGLSWQVVPRMLPEVLADADRARAARVMQAMMTMVKLDIAALEAAGRG
ncbi:MAG: VOC family protein [Phreatobacter sp.]|uniref:VOC family protein n=1 Tax=Phreatobacter sp. TaxID=1966341 RepID=UPI004035790E